MALDPRIPLGVQPIQQQPNMLGQYAQIMAIKAAQQETEGYEGVKSAIAGGMDATDPRMLQYGKRGIDAFKAAGEGRVKQQDALTKAFVNARESLGMVRTPEDLLAYTVSQFNDPLIGPRLKAQGLTPEAAAANLQKELTTSGFETVLKKSAMGLDGWFKDQTSRRNTDVSAAAPMMNARLNREKFNLEQQSQKSIQNVLADQVGPQGEPPSNVNALTGGGDVQQRVAQIDARIQQLVGLGTPDALRAADVLFKQRNAISPSTGAVPGSIQEFNLAKQQGFTGTFMDFKKERAALNAYGQPQEVTRKLEDGTSVTELVYPNPVAQTVTPLSNLVRTEPPAGAGGGAPMQTPATAGKMQLKEEGRENVEIVLDSLYDRYANLAKEGGITDTSKGTLANIKARAGASAAGQLVGSYTGSKEQEFRDSILQTRPLLLNAIKNATGMSAQQLNSNVELQTYLAVSTDPTKSIQANIEAMNNISKMFGLKKKFEMPSSVKSSSASATIEAPKDLPADIRELWKYMTPEDRKLWK
jgi:hypothetical protein